MSNYTDKVNERAVAFALEYHKEFWHQHGEQTKDSLIRALRPIAVVSVQREAEAVRTVLDNYLTDEKVIEIYLQSQGLME